MRMTRRGVAGWLGAIGLVLVGIGTLVALNWDAVSRSVGEGLDAQAERTKATLFRLGELMSISAELKREYGVEPDVTYGTETAARVLYIDFGSYQLPAGVIAEGHAGEIAAFAIGKTTKLEEIEAVEVQFESESFSFALDELKPVELP